MNTQLAEILQSLHASADNLRFSQQHLAKKFPLTANNVQALSHHDKERLDAFCLRFSKLQDLLGRQAFRAILNAELENTRELSTLDMIRNMEKREIVSNEIRWRLLHDVRNGLEHDYPSSPATRAELLNSAFQLTEELLNTHQKVVAYVQQHQL